MTLTGVGSQLFDAGSAGVCGSGGHGCDSLRFVMPFAPIMYTRRCPPCYSKTACACVVDIFSRIGHLCPRWVACVMRTVWVCVGVRARRHDVAALDDDHSRAVHRHRPHRCRRHTLDVTTLRPLCGRGDGRSAQAHCRHHRCLYVNTMTHSSLTTVGVGDDSTAASTLRRLRCVPPVSVSVVAVVTVDDASLGERRRRFVAGAKGRRCGATACRRCFSCNIYATCAHVRVSMYG